MKRTGINGCVVFLTLCFSLLAQGKDLYVRAGHSGDGTKANPYGDVDDALRSAFSGDVIHVAEGTYFGAANGGTFIISKPKLTLVGGYNKDFSERQPFLHPTRLMQGESPDPKMCRGSKRCADMIAKQKIPTHKSSYNPNAIIRGQGDHTGFVLDGFVIDGFTRHKYKSNEDLDCSIGPVGTPGVEFNMPGVKIRNCLVMNIAGPGIRLNALGTKLDDKDPRESGDDWAEVSNCVVVNTLMKSLDFTVGDRDEKNKPNGGCALIKNNTLAFNWEKLGHNYNIYQGRQTQLTIKGNVMAFAGFGIGNMFDNRFARIIGNTFHNHLGGPYRYFDPNGTKNTLILDNVADLDGEKCKKNYQCSKQSKGNVTAEPKFGKVDSFFLDKWFNYKSPDDGGKVTMDAMNQWRSAHGMPLQGAAGSGVSNFAPIYDGGEGFQTALIFASNLPGKGAQQNGLDGKFQTYQSTTGDNAGASGMVAASKDYKEIPWDDLKRAKKWVKEIIAAGDKGVDLTVKLKLADRDPTSYYAPASTGVTKDKGWMAYRDQSRDIMIYYMKGTEAEKLLDQAKKEGAEIVLKGTSYASTGSKDKVVIKVDAVEDTSSD